MVSGRYFSANSSSKSILVGENTRPLLAFFFLALVVPFAFAFAFAFALPLPLPLLWPWPWPFSFSWHCYQIWSTDQTRNNDNNNNKIIQMNHQQSRQMNHWTNESLDHALLHTNNSFICPPIVPALVYQRQIEYVIVGIRTPLQTHGHSLIVAVVSNYVSCFNGQK